MKTITLFLLAASLFISCETNRSTPVEFAGAWLNKAYLDTLIATQSPRAAQHTGDGVCTLIFIPDSTEKEAMLTFSFHDGVGYILRKKRDYYTLGDDLYNIKEYNDETLMIDDIPFVKTNETRGRQLSLVAEVFLFAGTYQ
ncbi:MAG: hypothetical protein AB8F95_17020 [Bacteroidia bacterium]